MRPERRAKLLIARLIFNSSVISFYYRSQCGYLLEHSIVAGILTHSDIPVPFIAGFY
jgi:hypothetical protein